MQKFMHILLLSTLLGTNPFLFADGGKEIFETYCWGCHHQTAVAFGPPFEEIASKRTIEEIKAMITDPKAVSKVFGYRRNAMPAFSLSDRNLTAISNYILSFKLDSNITGESNRTEEVNKTIVKEPYPSIASVKEKK